jgi:uncharacterized membrane protein YtjA (UPF0391 family)
VALTTVASCIVEHAPKGRCRRIRALRLFTAALARHLLWDIASAASRSERTSSLEESTMLHWAAVFLVIALIAALFGFGGIAAGAAGIAKVLFVLFIILALVAFVVGRRAPI